LAKELRTLNNVHKSVIKALETVTKESKKQTAELKKLEYAQKKAEDEAATLKQTLVPENSRLRLENDILQKRVEDLEDDVDKLTQMNIELEGKNARLGTKIMQQNEALRKRRDNFTRAEDSGANRNLSDMEDKISAIESDLSEAERKYQVVKAALKQEKGKRAELRKCLDSEKIKHAETSSKLDVISQTSDTKITNLKEALKAVKDTVEKAKNENAQLEAQAEKNGQKLNTLQSDLKQAGDKLKEEKIIVATLKAGLEEAFQRQLDYDPERLYKQLDDEKAARKRDIERLEAETKQLKKNFDDERAAHKAEMDREKKAHKASITRLETEIRNRQDTIASMKTQVTNLDSKFRTEQNITNTLGKDITRHLNTITSMDTHLRTITTARDGLQEMLYKASSFKGYLTFADFTGSRWECSLNVKMGDGGILIFDPNGFALAGGINPYQIIIREKGFAEVKFSWLASTSMPDGSIQTIHSRAGSAFGLLSVDGIEFFGHFFQFKEGMFENMGPFWMKRLLS
jgi:chromosome segregation ATPase